MAPCPRPFRWAEEVRATLSLAIPLVITQVAQIAIQATGVLMLGRLGETALTAGSLGATLGTFLWLFDLGIVTAVAPLASQAYGARSPRVLRVIVRQGMWVSVAIGVPFSLILTQGTAILVFRCRWFCAVSSPRWVTRHRSSGSWESVSRSTRFWTTP